MATKKVAISTTEWTKVTDAGESGTCWKTTQGSILIDHTDQETASTLPLTNTNVAAEKSKRTSHNNDNNDVLPITADNSSDIFYALAIGSAEENHNLVLDVE